MSTQVQVYQVISDSLSTNAALNVTYNGNAVSQEDKVQVIRRHYQMLALKKYGISLKDANGKALKNELVINGLVCKPSIPALMLDDNGVCVENIQQYYERTKKQAAQNYGKIFKGLERIDFVPEMK